MVVFREKSHGIQQLDQRIAVQLDSYEEFTGPASRNMFAVPISKTPHERKAHKGTYSWQPARHRLEIKGHKNNKTQ